MSSAFFKSSAHQPAPSAGQESTPAPQRPPTAAGLSTYTPAWSSTWTQPQAAASAVQRAPPLAPALRFPASRRYLWDRAARGSAVHIQAAALLPTLEVAPSILDAARIACNGPQLQQQTSVTLCGQLTTDAGGKERRLLLGPRQPGLTARPPGPTELIVPCTVAQEGNAAEADKGINTEQLRAALNGAINTRGPASLSQVFASQATLTLRQDGSAALCGRLIAPGAPLSLTPLAAKRVADGSLARALAAPMQAGSPIEDGLLTMDAARSLVPLQAVDPQVFSVPLVGAWVRGVTSTQHPLVLAACVRFAFAHTLPDKAFNEAGAFLLLVYPSGGCTAPECYEAQFQGDTGCHTLSLVQYEYQPPQPPQPARSGLPGGSGGFATPAAAALPSFKPALQASVNSLDARALEAVHAELSGPGSVIAATQRPRTASSMGGNSTRVGTVSTVTMATRTTEEGTQGERESPPPMPRAFCPAPARAQPGAAAGEVRPLGAPAPYAPAGAPFQSTGHVPNVPPVGSLASRVGGSGVLTSSLGAWADGRGSSAAGYGTHSSAGAPQAALGTAQAPAGLAASTVPTQNVSVGLSGVGYGTHTCIDGAEPPQAALGTTQVPSSHVPKEGHSGFTGQGLDLPQRSSSPTHLPPDHSHTHQHSVQQYSTQGYTAQHQHQQQYGPVSQQQQQPHGHAYQNRYTDASMNRQGSHVAPPATLVSSSLSLKPLYNPLTNLNPRGSYQAAARLSTSASQIWANNAHTPHAADTHTIQPSQQHQQQVGIATPAGPTYAAAPPRPAPPMSVPPLPPQYAQQRVQATPTQARPWPPPQPAPGGAVLGHAAISDPGVLPHQVHANNVTAHYAGLDHVKEAQPGASQQSLSSQAGPAAWPASEYKTPGVPTQQARGGSGPAYEGPVSHGAGGMPHGPVQQASGVIAGDSAVLQQQVLALQQQVATLQMQLAAVLQLSAATPGHPTIPLTTPGPHPTGPAPTTHQTNPPFPATTTTTDQPTHTHTNHQQPNGQYQYQQSDNNDNKQGLGTLPVHGSTIGGHGMHGGVSKRTFVSQSEHGMQGVGERSPMEEEGGGEGMWGWGEGAHAPDTGPDTVTRNRPATAPAPLPQQPISSNDSSPVDAADGGASGRRRAASVSTAATPHADVRSWLAAQQQPQSQLQSRSAYSTPSAALAASRRELFGSSTSSSAASDGRSSVRSSIADITTTNTTNTAHATHTATLPTPRSTHSQRFSPATPTTAHADLAQAPSDSLPAGQHTPHHVHNRDTVPTTHEEVYTGQAQGVPGQAKDSVHGVKSQHAASAAGSVQGHAHRQGSVDAGAGRAQDGAGSVAGSRAFTGSSAGCPCSSPPSALSPASSLSGASDDAGSVDRVVRHRRRARPAAPASLADHSLTAAAAAAARSYTSTPSHRYTAPVPPPAHPVATPTAPATAPATVHANRLHADESTVLRGSVSAGVSAIRSSADFIRTKLVTISDDESDGSDSDMDEQLMRKYGLKI